MWSELRLKAKSAAPLICHNGALADQTAKVPKMMKEISGKKSKTDADYERLAELEFQGSLYMGKDGPILPAEVIEATMICGAKKVRQGPKAKAGAFVAEHASLQYKHPQTGDDGPRTRDELWSDESFRIVAGVRVQTNRVMRTRPIFHDWECEFTVRYDDDQVNSSDVIEWFRYAGIQVGFGDWRPKYGRFTIEEVKAA